MKLALDVKDTTPVNAIHVTLRCTERTAAGHGKGRRIHRYRHFDHIADQPSGVLERGTRRFDVDFQLPPGIPASYAGREAHVEWELGLHIDIPWWPDVRRRQVLFVAAAPRAAPLPSPTVYATAEGGPRPGQLYIEASLYSAVY